MILLRLEPIEMLKQSVLNSKHDNSVALVSILLYFLSWLQDMNFHIRQKTSLNTCPIQNFTNPILMGHYLCLHIINILSTCGYDTKSMNKRNMEKKICDITL